MKGPAVVDRAVRARAFAELRRRQHVEQARDLSPAERIRRTGELSALARQLNAGRAAPGSDESAEVMLALARRLRGGDDEERT